MLHTFALVTGLAYVLAKYMLLQCPGKLYTNSELGKLVEATTFFFNQATLFYFYSGPMRVGEA